MKRHLWYTDLVLERSGELIIGFGMANLPYIKNFRSLELPHGLAEAPVVHQLDPDHLGGVIFFIFFVVLDLLVQIFELDLEDDDDDELHHLLTCVCVALPKVKT